MKKTIRAKQIRWEKRQRRMLKRKTVPAPCRSANPTRCEPSGKPRLSCDIEDYDTTGMIPEQREIAAALYTTGFFKGRPQYEPDGYFMRHNLLASTVEVCGRQVIVLKEAFGFRFHY